MDIEVNIVDAIMGSGKTSAMINYIKQSNDDVRFLYITPYLTEVNRVIDECREKNFIQPKEMIVKDGQVIRSKMGHIKQLFSDGRNIVSTHSLFSKFNNEIIDILYSNNYVLIMDEVADVVEILNITKHDLDNIIEKYAYVDENNNLLRWTATSYEGAFEKYKNMCELESIGVYNGAAMLWLFPIKVFQAFSRVYLLTYLFDAQIQKYYFDFYNVKYNMLYVTGSNKDDYKLTDSFIENRKIYISNLLHILDNAKLNRIGDIPNSLSKTWYENNKFKPLMNMLKNNVSNFFKNYTKTATKYNLWTTFKAFEDDIKNRGYAKGYVSSNMRATNAYKERTAVAYTINKFLNPYIKNFFIENGISVNEDMFALSEMVQFIWRSAIRDNKEIQLYCPSKRMRELLKEWINEVSI